MSVRERNQTSGDAPKRQFVRRWHRPSAPGAAVGQKVYISGDQVRQIVSTQLAGKIDKSFMLYLGDAEYYCPPMLDVEEIVRASDVDRHAWVEERFDCDDFAHVLKAHFAEAAYKDGTRRDAHCFGVVWGNLPEPHAINWVITDDLLLRFIEPQAVQEGEDKIFQPRPTDQKIYFMLC